VGLASSWILVDRKERTRYKMPLAALYTTHAEAQQLKKFAVSKIEATYFSKWARNSVLYHL